jgi:hypothetical protein
MNINNDKWEQIRDVFSEEEKQELRDRVIGQTICPAGNIIDTDNLDPAILNKLTAAVADPYGLHPHIPTGYSATARNVTQ